MDANREVRGKFQHKLATSFLLLNLTQHFRCSCGIRRGNRCYSIGRVRRQPDRGSPSGKQVAGWMTEAAMQEYGKDMDRNTRFKKDLKRYMDRRGEVRVGGCSDSSRWSE